MIRKIEGLVLKKIIYKERHIIAHLLLRSGKKVAVLCYGAQAGGKSNKSSILEIGHMLELELQVSKSTSGLYSSREWKLCWNSTPLRDHYKAFCVMSLMLEICEKVTIEDDLHDLYRSDDQTSVGYFNVLSNSLFFLDGQLQNDMFNPHQSLLIFLTKLSIQMGAFPERTSCVLSSNIINATDSVCLIFEEGGFALLEHTGPSHSRYGGDKVLQKELWHSLGVVGSHQFNELKDFDVKTHEIVRLFWGYFCYHAHYFESDFKAYNIYLKDL